MNINTKRMLSAFLPLFLLASLVLPVIAMGPAVSDRMDFITEESAVIGCAGYALTVRGDGSFTVSENESFTDVIFGERVPEAAISFNDSPYPVSTHKFSSKGIVHTVEQFVYKSEAGSVLVFSKLTAKNTTDVSVAFPKATGTVAIGSATAEIASKKTASQQYVTRIVDLGDSAPASYDDAKKLMHEYWDSFLGDKLTVSGLSKADAPSFKAYQADLIRSTFYSPEDLCALSLAAPSLAAGVLQNGADPYASALALLKTKDTETAIASLPLLKATANKIAVSEGKLPFLTLEENLSALLTLQGYAYILSELASIDDTYIEQAEKAKSDCAVLADNIAGAIKSAESRLSCDWESADTDASCGIVLCGEDFASATALVSWYIKSAPFSFAPSKTLTTLACDAKDYFSSYDSSTALLQSLITEKEDGTIIIGRGTPLSMLKAGASFTVEKYVLSDGTSISLSVSVKKNTVTISLGGNANAPIIAQFTAFDGNIEYASTGFDSASGTVTAPEGTKTITVRLIKSAKTLEKERYAAARLESAIAAAHTKDPEASYTAVSYEEFQKELKSAEKARTSTADKKLEAAESLEKATGRLSPMIAGYVYSLPESDTQVGVLTGGEIYQKFSLPSAGHVDSLFVKGEYCDGISAAVYTLRGDAYTTDELRAECYGEEAEGGITFRLDFDFESDTTYVLCVFCEEDDVTLYLDKSYDHTAYTQQLGETSLCTGASLALEFAVSQVDRSGLDTFYSACLEADVSEYTRESQLALKNKMKEAKEVLCSPSVTKDEYDKAYDDLKAAYDGLSTYASDEKVEEAPVVGLVLIGVVIALLAGTFISALLARKKMNS